MRMRVQDLQVKSLSRGYLLVLTRSDLLHEVGDGLALGDLETLGREKRRHLANGPVVDHHPCTPQTGQGAWAQQADILLSRIFISTVHTMNRTPQQPSYQGIDM